MTAQQGYLVGLAVSALVFIAWRGQNMSRELQSLTWKVNALEGRLPKPDGYPADEMPPVKVVVVGSEV